MFNLFKKKTATPTSSPDAKGQHAQSSASTSSGSHSNTSNSNNNSHIVARGDTPNKSSPQKQRAVNDMEWERQLIRAVDENRFEDVHDLSLGAPSAKLSAALALACERGKIMSISLLLESGANIDHPMTPPLYYATVGGSLDAVRLLISRGAPAANAHDAVRMAIESLRKDILKELINAGAPLGPAPHGSRSALHWAALRGNTCAGILAYLLSLPAAQAHLNAIDTDRGATPLLLAVKSDKASHNSVRVLIGAGANVDQSDRFSLSPLYWAAVNRKTEAFEALLAAGADPNPPVLPLLPSIAAHVQLDKRRMDAIDDSLLEIVKALIVAGVSVRAKDVDEITAATRISSLVSTVVEGNDVELPKTVQDVFSVLLASGAVDTDFVDETVSGGSLLERLNIDAADYAVEGKSLVSRKRTSLFRDRALDVCLALRPLDLPTRVMQSILHQVCFNTERFASDKLKLQLVVLIKTKPVSDNPEGETTASTTVSTTTASTTAASTTVIATTTASAATTTATVATTKDDDDNDDDDGDDVKRNDSNGSNHNHRNDDNDDEDSSYEDDEADDDQDESTTELDDDKE
jgi:ankyrin repeat protein